MMIIIEDSGCPPDNQRFLAETNDKETFPSLSADLQKYHAWLLYHSLLNGVNFIQASILVFQPISLIDSTNIIITNTKV